VQHPREAEIHFFDLHYEKGMRWYRAQFPLWRPRGATGETSPYMLYHPLAPARAARDLTDETRFIALLREPVERAISHYWHCQRLGIEPLSLEEAIDAEAGRLASEEEAVAATGTGHHHRHHAYLARGEYAGQLERWFEHVGRERVLVVESSELFSEPETGAQVLSWLGLEPWALTLPAENAAPRLAEVEPGLRRRMREHFEPHNRQLEALLGRRMWADAG